MGRVRRYKKLKSIDPFAKKGKVEIDTVHDEPPGDHQDRVQKAINKANKKQNNVFRQYKKIANETIVIPLEEPQPPKKNENKIMNLKKKEDESMKQFKRRIRQQTKLALRDEFKRNSSTAQKKKARLKERKLNKKGHVKSAEPFSSQEGFERFGASESGIVRPSDEQHAPITFKGVDKIQFGERVDCPPDFRHVYSMAGARKTGLISTTEKRIEGGRDREGREQQSRGGGLKRAHNDDDNDNENERMKKKRSRQEIETSSSNNSSTVRGGAGLGAGGGGGKEDPMLKLVMERERVRVIEAYKTLQKKRREENGRNFSTLD